MKVLRLKNALTRLEQQLISGVKTDKKERIGQKKYKQVPLTDSDKKRIDKEIVILKNNISKLQ
jgi:hypothetical protein